MTDKKHQKKPQKKTKHPRRVRQDKRQLRVIIICVIITAVLALLGMAFSAWRLTCSTYGGNDSVRVCIPVDATPEAVRDTLVTDLGDGYGNKVYRLWRWRTRDEERPSAYGSYVVRPGDKVWTVSNSLYKRRQTPVRVTINNVRMMSQLAENVSSRMDFDAEDFIAAADSVLPALSFFRPESFPAAFVPDTYEFYWTEPADKVIRSLVKTRNEFWTKEREAKAEALGLTPADVATVASIVEEETRDNKDRGMVARLYLNRIARGMKLQADPTVKFATGDFGARRIKGDMLASPSPYNTYRVEGLPPGPIRIPERATIDIVLNAPQHNYLFMCASPKFNGTHDFAVDYATHQKNARAYQAELNRRGIHE